MAFTKITTAGAGTMGSQVAGQMAFHGKARDRVRCQPRGLGEEKAFDRQYAEHL